MKNRILNSLSFYRTFYWWLNLSVSKKIPGTVSLMVSCLLTALLNQARGLTRLAKLKRDFVEPAEAEKNVHMLTENFEKRVEELTLESQEHESQLGIVTNALPVLIAQVDQNNRVLFANEKFCRWIGTDGSNVIGRSFDEIVGESRYKSLLPFINRVLIGEAVSCEQFERLPSGSTDVVHKISFMPYIDRNNMVASYILVAEDVTRIKEFEAELKNAKERADAANSTKSAFLANMSHEIRTPLGAILSFSELMLGHELTSAERSHGVEVIKRNGFLLSNIINDILDLSKVEVGKLEIEKIPVHFLEVVREIESLLNLIAAEKGIKLTVGTEGVVPEVIYTDPLRLRQILVNIVGNAIKFTQQGFVEVKVCLVQSVDGVNKLHFLIKDTGKGIKPFHANSLFEPFSQEDVSTTRKYGGTGLGLVLSKKLANSLGGDVVLLESVSDVGSVFSVSIDPGDSSKVLNKNFQMSENRKHYSSINKEILVDFSKLNILVVDDSLDNQLIVTHLLRSTGAKIDTANNGLEGLEKALVKNYDVILMDLQMPVLDGYGALKELKTLHYAKPVIALTAHAMREERTRCIESGFIDHISKPVDRKLLIQAISKHTENSCLY